MKTATRDIKYYLRMTPAEYDIIERKAESLGLTVAAYMRLSAVKYPTEAAEQAVLAA